MPALRATSKLIAFALLVMAIIPTQSLLLLFKLDRAASRWGQLWHRAVCRVLQVNVEVEGRPIADAHAAYVGNHLSYLDIPVLGSVVCGSFTAKREMCGWPLFGLLAQLQRTVFISRERRDATRVMGQVDALLDSRRNLIVFPEGTSSPGMRVLPFKSSVFSVLQTHLDNGLLIQPFTIDLRAVDGRTAISVADRDQYAYYGDMTLAPHFWAFMRGKGARVRLIFHAPLTSAEAGDRKRMAAAAHARVASGLERSRVGDVANDQFEGG
ncbi:MAG: lysophospholipid acyltransferase family protein [Luteimonas sp.]